MSRARPSQDGIFDSAKRSKIDQNRSVTPGKALSNPSINIVEFIRQDVAALSKEIENFDYRSLRAVGYSPKSTSGVYALQGATPRAAEKLFAMFSQRFIHSHNLFVSEYFTKLKFKVHAGSELSNDDRIVMSLVGDLLAKFKQYLENAEIVHLRKQFPATVGAAAHFVPKVSWDAILVDCIFRQLNKFELGADKHQQFHALMSNVGFLDKNINNRPSLPRKLFC